MTVPARRSSLLLVLALACIAVALAVSARQATASSYHTCSLSSSDKSPGKHGPTYLKKLKVKGGPSCAYAKSFVKAYYSCRTKGSKPATGHCSSVLGYSCSETRFNNIVTSFDAKATCKKGSKAIYHEYQQFKD